MGNRFPSLTQNEEVKVQNSDAVPETRSVGRYSTSAVFCHRHETKGGNFRKPTDVRVLGAIGGPTTRPVGMHKPRSLGRYSSSGYHPSLT